MRMKTPRARLPLKPGVGPNSSALSASLDRSSECAADPEINMAVATSVEFTVMLDGGTKSVAVFLIINSKERSGSSGHEWNLAGFICKKGCPEFTKLFPDCSNFTAEYDSSRKMGILSIFE